MATVCADVAPKATGPDFTLHSRDVGALPVVNAIVERMDLESILADFLPWEDRRNKVKTVAAILLVAKNIRLSREPLYGIGPWAAGFVPELQRRSTIWIRPVRAAQRFNHGPLLWRLR